MSCTAGITNMTLSSTAAIATDASPPPDEQARRERHADELRETGEPFDDEVRAEDLVDAGERPQAAGAVEVEEVLVRDRAVQHPVGEDEHEALFHRRARCVQQRAEREQVRDDGDRERGSTRSPRGRRAVAAVSDCNGGVTAHEQGL